METLIFDINDVYLLFMGGFGVGLVIYFVFRVIQGIFDSFVVLSGTNKDL